MPGSAYWSVPSWSRFPNPENRIIKTTQYVECLATESLLTEQIASLTWDNTLHHGWLYIHYRTKKTTLESVLDISQNWVGTLNLFRSLPRSNNEVVKQTTLACIHYTIKEIRPSSLYPPAHNCSRHKTVILKNALGFRTVWQLTYIFKDAIVD